MAVERRWFGMTSARTPPRSGRHILLLPRHPEDATFAAVLEDGAVVGQWAADAGGWFLLTDLDDWRSAHGALADDAFVGWTWIPPAPLGAA